MNDAGMINPFVHRLEFNGYYERIKVTIMSVTALPVRVMAMFITLTIAWLIAVSGLIGHRQKEKYNKPLSRVHREIMKPILSLFLRLIFFFCGWHWITIKGKQASPKEAPILALAPHSSFFDAIVTSALGAPSVVAKSEIMSTPFFGALTRYCEPIYVSREDQNSRQNTMQEIARRSNDSAEWSCNQIAIYPEGTCTNRKCLITFKPGAFLPGVPVQPVCLKYKNKNDVVSWTFEGPSAIQLMWRSLCQFHNYFEIEFLPVYNPNEEERKDANLYAENVRNIMAKCLNVPIMNCTYYDNPIILKTIRTKYPIETHLASVQQLRSNLRLDSPRSEIAKYIEFTKTKEEHVTLEKYSEHLQVSICDNLCTLFHIYEQHQTQGVINFRDYMLDLCLLCGPTPQSEPPILLAFKAMDKTGRVQLDLKQLDKMLSYIFDLTPDETSRVFTLMDSDSKGYVTYDDYLSFCKRKSFFPKLFIGFSHLVTKATEDNGHVDLPSKIKSERV